MNIINRVIQYCIVFLLVVTSAYTSASTLYINDVVFVPLRSGPSTQHRILHKGLKSGTALKLLSDKETDGFVNVETNGGLNGWLPKHYLIKSPTAALRLAKNTEALNKTQSEKNKLEKSSSELGQNLKKTQTKVSKLEREKQQLTLELSRLRSISSGAIELDQKYQTLLENHELLQTSNDALNAENTSLKSDRRFSYMFYGAMLLILGMLMAVLIPHLKVKKRHSEWVN